MKHHDSDRVQRYLLFQRAYFTGRAASQVINLSPLSHHPAIAEAETEIYLRRMEDQTNGWMCDYWIIPI